MRCHCRPSAAALAQCCSLINLDVPNPSFPTGMTIVTTVTGPGWSPPNILMLWHDHRPDAPCFIPGKRCKEPLAAPCIRNPYLAPPTPPLPQHVTVPGRTGTSSSLLSLPAAAVETPLPCVSHPSFHRLAALCSPHSPCSCLCPRSSPNVPPPTAPMHPGSFPSFPFTHPGTRPDVTGCAFPGGFDVNLARALPQVCSSSADL